MTTGFPQGTAQSAAFEMYLLYKLPVAVVPTNRPRLRVDMPLELYWTQEDKFQVLAGAVGIGRPTVICAVACHTQ